jgi:hypothetical protein
MKIYDDSLVEMTRVVGSCTSDVDGGPDQRARAGQRLRGKGYLDYLLRIG